MPLVPVLAGPREIDGDRVGRRKVGEQLQIGRRHRHTRLEFALDKRGSQHHADSNRDDLAQPGVGRGRTVHERWAVPQRRRGLPGIQDAVVIRVEAVHRMQFANTFGQGLGCIDAVEEQQVVREECAVGTNADQPELGRIGRRVADREGRDIALQCQCGE